MVERIGRVLFAIAIVAIGVESIVCLQTSVTFVKPAHVLPIMPYPPASPALAVVIGLVTIACGIALLSRRGVRAGAIAFAVVYVVSALVFDLPRLIAHPESVPLRTLFFQPLTMGALAWMLPEAGLPNDWRATLARYAIAVSLAVFGADHFAAFAGIAGLVPNWIPFHAFWAAFCGVAFIAAGVAFAANVLRGWAAAGMALMFAIFLVTLHIPSALGAYGNPGAIRDPDQWCSIFIVLSLCGGFLALAKPARR